MVITGTGASPTGAIPTMAWAPSETSFAVSNSSTALLLRALTLPAGQPARELARQRMTEEPSLCEGLSASVLLSAFVAAETISNPFDLAPDESSRHLLAAVLMNGSQEILTEQVEDAFHSLRHSQLERRQRELRRSLAEAELRNDTSAVKELMTEKIALDRLLREDPEK